MVLLLFQTGNMFNSSICAVVIVQNMTLHFYELASCTWFQVFGEEPILEAPSQAPQDEDP